MLLLAFACAGTDDDSAPLAYQVDDPAPLSPELEAEDAERAVASVFAAALSYDANDAHRALDAVMTGADEACPRVDSSPEGGSIWDDNCTASTGATFDGVLASYTVSEPYYARAVTGEATVALADGTVFVIAGGASTQIAEGREWVSDIEGVVRYSAAEDGSWLAEGVDLNFSFAAAVGDAGTVETVQLDGTVGELGDDVVSAVSFDQLVVSDASDFPCADEPAGGLAVRDAAGVWTELVFDVVSADDGYSLTGECDGCGHLWYDGEDLGEVCVDPSPLLGVTPPEWP